MITAPGGFVVHEADAMTLLAAPERIEELMQADIGRACEHLVENRGMVGTGRGKRGIVDLPSGERLWLKQNLRGGLLARFNRERYFLLKRFGNELLASLSAASAGCPIVPTEAVLFKPAAPGWRVWSAAKYIDNAPDLAGMMHSCQDPALARKALAATIEGILRMHDGGLYHRDLNLGNILLPAAGGALIVDLDRARFFKGGVPHRYRERACTRFLRSWRKILGEGGVLPLREVEKLILSA